MADTWTSRDLPVLKAIVDIYEEVGMPAITPDQIQQRVGFDDETVYRALRALETEPYFGGAQRDMAGDILVIGPPTSKALRVVGNWPSPEAMLERLVGALEAAGDDPGRTPEERSKFKQAASWLGSFASQVAIGALGGAGGNIISG